MSATAPLSGHSPSQGEARATLSACVISFNEERHIDACLESLAFCDETIVVDSFSTDRTVELARARGARVIQEKWRGHVAQKNLAIDAAARDWVLCLDCDERVTPRLRDAILDVLRADARGEGRGIDGYLISRKLFYLGRWLEHGGWFPEWRLRLIRRGRGRWTGTDPHDTLAVDGRTARIPAAGAGDAAPVILHYSFRDLSHQLKVLDRYSEIQAGELFRRGRRAGCFDLTFRPLARFLLTYVGRGGFLDGSAGFHMAVNHAYAAYMKYARLWELQRGLASQRAKEDIVPTRAESREAPAP